ncbi:MAG: hypothetical protein F6K02_31880 [Moorea sp. SIO3A5]|nr:hypothetical protein [Moorena sp. SIO3A5]
MTSDAEVRPVANLIRQRKAHLSGLGGFPHERLHQDKDLAFEIRCIPIFQKSVGIEQC